MANAITQQLNNAWGRVHSGPVGNFFRWWISELRLAMPQSWQEKLQHALRRVILSVDADSLRVGSDENRRVEFFDQFPLSQESSLQKQQVDELLLEQDLGEAARFFLLDAGKVLKKVVRMPLATESNLGQVLGFEMDRQTPFRASDVYFDFRILSRDTENGQLEIELFVVPRSEVDGAVESLRGRGFRLAGVDVLQGDETMGLNLLPAEQRAKTVNARMRINMALAIAVVGLLALAMWQSLALREHQVAELEEAIAEVQGEARAVMKIRDQIEDTSEAASFLARRRSATPLSIEVISDVTQILPDDTYLDRLVINRETVQMQGKSSNAQQLIELVNESELLTDASFRGSTRLDARTGLEIFEINAAHEGVASE